MDLSKIHSIFMIGIGGIGMSAIARHFKSLGKKVAGYDRVSTPLTRELEAEGIAIYHDDKTKLIPEGIDLVVYTPAIPSRHQQLTYLREQGFEVMKRSQVLEQLTKDKFTIAVGGSHGKTTVTAMIAHILKDSGYDCTAFIGGITLNYGANYLKGDNEVVVVEADEFDRSFLRLHPTLAIITAVDTDHLDIYGSRENIEEAFLQFVENVKSDGRVVVHSNVSILAKLPTGKVITYGSDRSHANYQIDNLRIIDGSYHFNITGPDVNIREVVLHMGGEHNVENALAASVVANQLRISQEKITAALASFKGIRRRFEYVIRTDDIVLIDDYAHHPREIDALLSSVKALYPDRKVTVIFQPHLFSRTEDLYKEFATSLSKADQVILLEIYPAREEPKEGVSSKLVYDELMVGDRQLTTKADLLSVLKEEELEVLLTVGAGDIDQLVQPVKELLENKYQAA